MLHQSTPLFDDVETSTRIGRRVTLKMECFQPVGSFKIRGIGLLCEHAMQQGTRRFVSSSGGNAGFAVTYAAQRLAAAATVVVPSSTPKETCDCLRLYGAEVFIHGDVWDTADLHARELAAVEGAADVPPFDHPLLWEGHATLVDEMAQSGSKPDIMIVAVGGGGLLCGVLQGLHRNGWQDVKVLAVETIGAESLHRSMIEKRLVTLPAITSIAKSLGARRVASEALKWTTRHDVESVVVSDESAMRSCVSFARSQRVLVEPACGAALAVVHENHAALGHAQHIAVVVCGGISVGIVAKELAR